MRLKDYHYLGHVDGKSLTNVSACDVTRQTAPLLHELDVPFLEHTPTHVTSDSYQCDEDFSEPARAESIMTSLALQRPRGHSIFGALVVSFN